MISFVVSIFSDMVSLLPYRTDSRYYIIEGECLLYKDRKMTRM